MIMDFSQKDQAAEKVSELWHCRRTSWDSLHRQATWPVRRLEEQPRAELLSGGTSATECHSIRMCRGYYYEIDPRLSTRGLRSISPLVFPCDLPSHSPGRRSLRHAT